MNPFKIVKADLKRSGRLGNLRCLPRRLAKFVEITDHVTALRR